MSCNTSEHTHVHEHGHVHTDGHDHGHAHRHSPAEQETLEHGHGHEHACCSCGCGAEEGDETPVSRKIVRLGIVLILAAAACLVPGIVETCTQMQGGVVTALRIALFVAAYLAAGGDVLRNAARNIAHGEIFDENFLMCVATVGAFAIGEYPEAVGVMLFYQIGEAFQDYAVGKSRKSVAALMDIRPDTAHVLRDGTEITVAPETVHIGDTVVIHPGERIPVDGVVLSGDSYMDTSSLTGESVPRHVAAGSTVLSGVINGNGVLSVRAEKAYAESTAAKILDLVENAAAKKASAEKFITRFARYYTPAVCISALLLAVVPPFAFALLTDAGFHAELFSAWLYRALVFLVVSCPCALVISVPLSFFGGIGAASRNGILVKGGNCLEQLAKAGIAVFDKTGTLTKGEFEVTMTHVAEKVGITAGQLRAIAAHAEYYSAHPISASLKKAHRNDEAAARGVLPENGAADTAGITDAEPACCAHLALTDVSETAGQGIQACLDGKKVLAGNARLMEAQAVSGFSPDSCTLCAEHHTGTVVHVAVDGEYAGHIVIADTEKPDAAAAIADLKKAGVQKTVILTGDSQSVADAVAASTGADEVKAELLPAGKVEEVERLYQSLPAGTSLLFTGDGINDAPVLARADVGIAMGALGSDAAIEAADVVIMDDQPSKIAVAVRIARRTIRIVKQNIVFSLGIKAVVLIGGAAGITTMWAAVFADVGVALLATLNAVRVLRFKDKK